MVAKKSTKKTGSARTAEKPSMEVYEAVESVKKGAKKTDSYVRKHPWRSVGIAAVLGAFISRLFFRRRR
ncbi:DUF883 family protein [Candidatus Woesearchaeota archaeon]|nr:DUF883 family protein [Candidatus Woesearchaeota archaeon]